MKLTKGKIMLCDPIDFRLIQSHSFYGRENRRTGAVFYSFAKISGKHKRFHNLVLQSPTGSEVDHIDGNGLNNRRHNLRIVAHKENTRNRRLRITNVSGTSGVFKTSDGRFWAVRWYLAGDQHYAHFSIKVYGDDLAKRLAIEARDEMIPPPEREQAAKRARLLCNETLDDD